MWILREEAARRPDEELQPPGKTRCQRVGASAPDFRYHSATNN